MSTALRNRIIPHTPALPRAFIGHGECGREYDGVFSDVHCGGVVWSNQERRRYRDPDAPTERTKLALVVFAVAFALFVLGAETWRRWATGATW